MDEDPVNPKFKPQHLIDICESISCTIRKIEEVGNILASLKKDLNGYECSRSNILRNIATSNELSQFPLVYTSTATQAKYVIYATPGGMIIDLIKSEISA